MKATALRPSDSLYGRTRANDVWHRLREDILSGVLFPGQRLRFEKLRELYDVSYATIREALSKLAHEGLVVADAQRGFTVTPISEAGLIDLINVRILVEKEALARSIANGDEEWKASVLGSFHKMDKLGRSVESKRTHEWFACHRAFHANLVFACDSPLLLEYRATLFDKANRYRRLSKIVQQSVDIDRSNEHRDMMEAVVARDSEYACKLAARHIEATMHVLLAGLRPVQESETGSTPLSRARSAGAALKEAGVNASPPDARAVAGRKRMNTRVRRPMRSR